MSLKSVYDFLEASEEGKKLLDSCRSDLDRARDAEAKARAAEQKAAEMKAAADKAAETLKKLEQAGIDLDDLDDLDNLESTSKGKKSEAERNYEKLQKQMNVMTEQLQKAEAARAVLEEKNRVTSLKNDFGNALREVFGKPGELLVENLIAKGAIKYDAEGRFQYEVDDKIYDKTGAIEHLKNEYKELIAPKQVGSNAQPPAAGAPRVSGAPVLGKTVEELTKMSPGALFEMGLKTT